MIELFLDEVEIRLILNFLPNEQRVWRGLDPTFYHSGSYDGDVKIHEAVSDLRIKLVDIMEDQQ